MNRPAKYVVVLLICALCVFFLVHGIYHRQDRAALIVVYRQLKAWEKECILPTGRQDLSTLRVKYYTLNTDDCPQAFRLAWFDYITAVQAQQKLNGEALIDLVLAAGTEGATTAFAGEQAAGAGMNSTYDHPDLAVRAVQRFWIEYDIGLKDL